jgi:hypothetical protein
LENVGHKGTSLVFIRRIPVAATKAVVAATAVLSRFRLVPV